MREGDGRGGAGDANCEPERLVGLRVSGLGFMVYGPRCRVYGLWFVVHGLRFIV